MGEMEWILLTAGPLFAVIGAIMLALQKRGKSNPVISAEEAGGHVISGGGIMLIGIVFGTIPTVSDIRNGGSGVFGGISDDLYSDPCDLS